MAAGSDVVDDVALPQPESSTIAYSGVGTGGVGRSSKSILSCALDIPVGAAIANAGVAVEGGLSGSCSMVMSDIVDGGLFNVASIGPTGGGPGVQVAEASVTRTMSEDEAYHIRCSGTGRLEIFGGWVDYTVG